MTNTTVEKCFIEIRNGANIKQGTVDGGYPITRIETLSNDKFNRDRMGYAGVTDLEKYTNFILFDGDILMSHINSVHYLGRSVVYRKKGDESIIHGMNLLRLIPNYNSVDPDYINFYFYGKKFRSDIARITKKSVNQASFSVSDLKKIIISLPAINIQKNISEILVKIKTLIESKQHQLSEYDQLIKSRFVEMFGDIFSDKSKYPTIKISKVVIPKIERAKKSFNDDEEIKYVDISSIDNKKNAIVGYTEYLMKDAPSRAQQHIRKDDILISTVRPNLNNVAKVSHDYSNIVASSGFCILRVSKFEPNYLFALVSMQLFADYLSSLTTGANYPAVSDKDILNFEIPNAPIEEQIEFSKFVEQVDKLKFEVLKLLRELR